MSTKFSRTRSGESRLPRLATLKSVFCLDSETLVLFPTLFQWMPELSRTVKGDTIRRVANGPCPHGSNAESCSALKPWFNVTKSRGIHMTPQKGNPVAPMTPTPFEPISIGKMPPEVARQNFHALLLANPNFFGNIAESPFKPVLSILGNTEYESIGCVGYNPQLEQLRATINIKQTGGYSGGICSTGSEEYVRFYLSYDGGSTWQDQ